ncbi:mucin-5AC-like [Haliotis rufescens]|uniref:mucin-5AC-like n=1 Tax=Haliotis rufescens TaxID=6454 RepID=UPI00201F90A5|nr:mucin-5AC-like [Haliotis rufescens]
MLLRTFLLSVIILGFVIHHTDARGVLTIRLFSFENHKGRTYDGSCCDQTAKSGNTCPDQCDYVMRLIISGLGRANDHVFLFHRPLKYDANDISFQDEGTDMVLTILFDEWPNMGHVKMNVFFYDYDDYDHTTLLVDWFENELSRTVEKGHFQKAVAQGNRQSDKTSLEFEWSVHCFTANDCLQPPPEWKSWPWDRKEQETKPGLYIPKSTSEKTPHPTTTLELTNDSHTLQWKNGEWKKSHNTDEGTGADNHDFDAPAIGSRDEKYRNVRRKVYGTSEKTTSMYEGISAKAVTNIAIAPVAADAHRSWPASQNVKGQSQHKGNALKTSIKSGTKVNRQGFRNPYTRPSNSRGFVKKVTPAVGKHGEDAIKVSSVRKSKTKNQHTTDVNTIRPHNVKAKKKSGLAIKHGISPFSKPNENDSSARKQSVRYMTSTTDASMAPNYYSTGRSRQPISLGKTPVPKTRTFKDAVTNQAVISSDKPVDRSTIAPSSTRRNPYHTFKTASWKWIHHSSTVTSTDRLPHTSSKPQGATTTTPSYTRKNIKGHTTGTMLKKPVTTASTKASGQVKKANTVKQSPWRKPTKATKQPQDTSAVTEKKQFFPKDKWQTQSTKKSWAKKHEILSPSTQSYFWHASTTDKHRKEHTRKTKTVTSYKDQHTTRTYVWRGSSRKPRRKAAPTVPTQNVTPSFKDQTTRKRFGERKRKYFSGALKNRYELMYEAEHENKEDKAKPMVRLPSKTTERGGSKSIYVQPTTKPKPKKTERKAIPAVVVGHISKQKVSTQRPQSENHSKATAMSTKITQSIRKNAPRRPFQPWSSSVTEQTEPVSTTAKAITSNIARKTLMDNIRKTKTSSSPNVQAVTTRAFQSWAASKSTKQSTQTHPPTTKRMKSTSSVRPSEKVPSVSSPFKPTTQTVKVQITTKPSLTKPTVETVSHMKKKSPYTPPKSTTGSNGKNMHRTVRPTVKPLTATVNSPFAPVKPSKETEVQEDMLKDLKSMVQSNMKKMITDDTNLKIRQHTKKPKNTTLTRSNIKIEESPFKTTKVVIGNGETSTQMYPSTTMKQKWWEWQTTKAVGVTTSRSAPWTHFTRWWQRPQTVPTLPPLKVLPAGVNEGKVLDVVDEYKRMKIKTQKTKQSKISHSLMKKVPTSSTKSQKTPKSKAKVNPFVKLRSTTMSHPTHGTTRTTNKPQTTHRRRVNPTTKKLVSITETPKKAAPVVTASTPKYVPTTRRNRHKGTRIVSTKVTKVSKSGKTTSEKIDKTTQMSGWNPFTEKTSKQFTTRFHTTVTPQPDSTKITRWGIRKPGMRNKAQSAAPSKRITDKHNQMTGHPTTGSPRWGKLKPAVKKPSPIESPFKKETLSTLKVQNTQYPRTTRWGKWKPTTITPKRTDNGQRKISRPKSNIKEPLNIKTFNNRHTTTPPHFDTSRNTRKWRYITGEKNVHKGKTTNIWEGLMSTRIITSRRTIPMGPAPTQKTPFQLKNLNKLKNWERDNQSKKTVSQPKKNDSGQNIRHNPRGQHTTRRNYAPTRMPVLRSTSRKVTRWWQRRTSSASQTVRTTAAKPKFRKVTLPPSVNRSTRWWKRINRKETPRTTPATFVGTSTGASSGRNTVYTLRPTRWWRRVKTTTPTVSSTDGDIPESRLTPIPTNAPTKTWQRRKGNDKTTVETNSGRKSVFTKPDSKKFARYTGRPTRFWQRRTTTANTESPSTKLWKKKTESVTKPANAMYSKHSTRSWRRRTTTQSMPTSRSKTVITSSIFTPKTRPSWGRHTRKPIVFQKTSPSSTKTLNTKSPLQESEEKNKNSKSDVWSTISAMKGMDATSKYDRTTRRTTPTKSWQRKMQTTQTVTTTKPLTKSGQGRTLRKYPSTTMKPVTQSWQRRTQRKLIKTTTKPQTKSWQRRTKTNHMSTTTKPQTKSWQRRTKSNHMSTTTKPQTKSWQRRTKTNHMSTATKPQTKSWQRRTKTNHMSTTTKPQTKSWQRRTKTNHMSTTTKPQTKSWQRRTNTNHMTTTTKPQTKSWQRRNWATTAIIPQTKSWQRRKLTTPETARTRPVTVKKTKHHTTTHQSATKWWARRRTTNVPETTSKTDSRNNGKSSDAFTKTKHMWTTVPLPDAKKGRGVVTTSKIDKTTDKMKGWNIFEFLPEVLSKMYSGQSVEEMKKEKNSFSITSAAAGATPNPKQIPKSTPAVVTTRPLIVVNHDTKKNALKPWERSKMLKTLMPTTMTRLHGGRSTTQVHQRTSYRTSTLPTNRGRNSSTRQHITSTARPKDVSKVKQTGINHTTVKGDRSTSRKGIQTESRLNIKKLTSTTRGSNVHFKTTQKTPHVTSTRRNGGIKIGTTTKRAMKPLSTTPQPTRKTTTRRSSTTQGKATSNIKPPSKKKTTLSSILKTTTKPVKIDLTLPNWISLPTKRETTTKGMKSKKNNKNNKNNKSNKTKKTKNIQKKKTQSKTTVAPTKKVATTKKTPQKTPKGKPVIAKPKNVKKKFDLKALMKKKFDAKKKADVKKKTNAKTETDPKKKDGKKIGISVDTKKPVAKKIDTKKTIISRKIVPKPTVTLLNKTSDKGPRVIVPNDGLFVPGPTKIVKIVTSQKDENGTITEEEVFVAIPSNSEAQQIGLQVKRLNIQTVFNRYWPAILGLTIGTVFLVAAVLTSVACRAQRLYVQRSRYNDQPQHLTEPPDTSEYSSSAASLVSDATRSSIRL